jgi:hypothetical protein
MSLRSTILKVFAALVLAAAVFTPAAAAPPAGKIQINYHRADGNYKGWGIHLWKSPNMPLEGIEWPNPMAPTGNNEFGVYWVRDEDEFANKAKTKMNVNYIIHQGDVKEQGGKDQVFNGLECKEIWVVQGDNGIYKSLAEVKTAHPDLK